MGNTLKRPLFKQGPDGQMRTAALRGGLKQLYKAGKYFAPKFSNVPYNFNAAMTRMGVPTITGKRRSTGIDNPFVGNTGPMNPSAGQSYDFRMKQWTDKLDNLKDKNGIGTLQASGLKGMKAMPQEVIDHWQTLPKMSGKRRTVEQLLYPTAYSMGSNWMDDHAEQEGNVQAESGSVVQEPPAQNNKPSQRQPGLFGSKNDVEGPITPGSDNVPDDSVADLDSNDDYDGAQSDRQPGLSGSEMPDLVSEAIVADDSISPKSIEDYKKELQAVIGKEDNTMGSLLLMQLGLGMMAGTSNQAGFAGFAEIAGKTGQQVLPMFMEHMQNKRKEDKEIALAAYEMLRTDRASKTQRENDLIDWRYKEDYKLNDWIGKEQYKNTMNPPGDLSMVQVNNPFTLPSGEVVNNWSNVGKQMFSKSPEALRIMGLNDPNVRVVPFNMTEAGMKSLGLGDMNLTKAQRGEQSLLAGVYKSNLPQILNFVTDPEIGVHSGNFQTGSAGLLLKTARFVTRDVQNFFNTILPGDSVASNAMSGMYGTLRSTTEDTMQGLVDSQMGLLAGEGNVATKIHGGQKDVQFGKYMDETGNLRDGNYATDQYVRNLMDNQFYDVNEQMINMMGFLEARLKQPTGRLLADTIQRSINNLANDKMLTSGDPKQYANKMHTFVRRLYNAYAEHAMRAGTQPETQFGVGRLGQPLTIDGYNQSYLNFVGNENIDQGIDLGFMNQFPNQQTIKTGNAPGNIYPGTQEVIVNGSADFKDLLQMYTD